MYGKLGVFPSEYVRPVAAPDFLILPPDRVEPRDRHGHVAASAAIAVAMGSSVAAHELDLSTEVKKANYFQHPHKMAEILDFRIKNSPILLYQLFI